MMTVNEVSRLTGVSIRTLRYYDKIGLLLPAGHTVSGYRLYDGTALEKLRQILMFRELEFSLEEIKTIMSDPDYDRNKALEQQIQLLTLKKERLEALIDLACGIRKNGVINMDFTAFDTSRIDEYSARAKASWGNTPEYREYEERGSDMTKELVGEMMSVFARFGAMTELAPDDEKVQSQVKKLQDFISDNFYKCSDETLYGLGQMYASDREYTENIDKAGGKGTAEFVCRAIERYCGK